MELSQKQKEVTPTMTSLQKLLLCLLPLAVLGCGKADQKPETAGSASQTSVERISAEPVDFGPVVPDDQRGFETPESAYTAIAKAADDRDNKALVAAFTVDSQQAIAGQMMFALMFAGAFDESQQENAKALLARHGLTEETNLEQSAARIAEDATQLQRMQALGSLFQNPAAFATEVFDFFDRLPNASGKFDLVSGELHDVKIEGDTATAVVKHRRGRKPIAFRRSKAGWLLELTEDQFSTSDGLTVSGSGKVDEFGMSFDEQPESLAPVTAITADELQRTWKVSVDYQKQAAGAALQDITQKCGLTIFDQPEFAEALQQTVSVKLQDVSPLEVIEAVCSQVKLHPRYKAGKMAFSERPRALPVAFAGPFLIEATKIHEYVPNAFAEVHFQCFAAGLPAAATSRLNGLYVRGEEDENAITFQLPQWKGSDGSALECQQQGFFPAKASKSSVEFRSTVDTAKLLQAVESIADFEGSISWSFPTKIESAKIDKLEKGTTVGLGDATITVDNVNLQDQFSSVSLQLTGVGHKSLSVVAFDASGQTMDNAGAFLSGVFL